MIFRQYDNKRQDDYIAKLAESVKLSFLTTKILVNREIDTKEKVESFLNSKLSDLYDPFLLNNMNILVDKINDALKNKKSVLIFGDYDVDGISATAILYKYFQNKGLKVSYFLPNRYEDGYGLTIKTAEKVINEYKPDLLITVDCGISCYKEIEYLMNNGVDVVVTDHHEVPEVLPKCPVIDAKIEGQKYPFKELCGAGIALKVVQALGENLDIYLPICALATVADIVDLTDENRAIVKLGLELFNNLPKGIKLLLNELNLEKIDSKDIAFKIAPKLNASGRMGDAVVSLLLYISNDEQVLRENLVKLNEMNVKRQELCNIIYEQTIKMLNNIDLNKSRAIVLYDKNWDSGLLGIVCARLVDEFSRPVFLFSEVDGFLKGSVRSIDKINIHDVLSSTSTLLETFGGHSMAAGLTLKTENIEKFKAEIENYLFKNYNIEDFKIIKYYDLDLDEKNINIKFAKELEKLEPFGCGNQKPVFHTKFYNLSVKSTKNFKEHLNLTTKNNFSLLYFNAGEYVENLENANSVESIYELQVNNFKGKNYLKGLIKNVKCLGYKDTLEDYVNGNYINQLVLNKCEKKNSFFNYESLDYTLKKLSNRSNFGTMIICNNLKNARDLYKFLMVNDYNFQIAKVKSHCANNCIIAGLNNLEDISKYSNFVFTEPLLSMDYLNNFKGNLYLPKNHNFSIKQFGINLDRDYFSNVYKHLIVCADKINKSNRYQFYLEFKRINPNIKLDYAQFTACLLTFLELGFISELKNDRYRIVFNKVDKKSELDSSVVYQRLKKIC